MIAELTMDPSQFVRQVAIPLGLAYLGLVLALVTYGRALRLGQTATLDPPGRRDRPLAARRQLVLTVTGGYGVFLSFTLGYYAFVAKQTSSFVFQALTGGAFMAFVIVLPGFALFTWIEDVLVPRLRKLGAPRERPARDGIPSTITDSEEPGVLGVGDGHS